MNINLDSATLEQIIGQPCAALPAGKIFKRIASLETASEDDLAVVFERGDRSVFADIEERKIKACRAGAIIASSALVAGRSVVVSDPLEIFQKLVDFAQPSRRLGHFQADARYSCAWVSSAAVVHEAAVIEAGVVIQAGASVGAGSFIGANAFIGYGVNIGAGVLIHPGAKVLDNCVVGDESIIHAGAVIGSDGFGYQVTNQGLRKVPQVGIVRIGCQVEIGANSTIDRASFDETVIGDGCKIDNMVHLAHNVQVGRSSAILAQTGVGGSVRIGVGCQIGGQVAIKDNVSIGDGARIVSKSGVMNNVDAGKTVAGVPAVDFNLWKRIAVSLNYLPAIAKQFVAMTSNPAKPSRWSMLRKKLGF